MRVGTGLSVLSLALAVGGCQESEGPVGGFMTGEIATYQCGPAASGFTGTYTFKFTNIAGDEARSVTFWYEMFDDDGGDLICGGTLVLGDFDPGESVTKVETCAGDACPATYRGGFDNVSGEGLFGNLDVPVTGAYVAMELTGQSCEEQADGDFASAFNFRLENVGDEDAVGVRFVYELFAGPDLGSVRLCGDTVQIGALDVGQSTLTTASCTAAVCPARLNAWIEGADGDGVTLDLM